MRLPRTAEFDAEREVYSLRFCCEDCGHFDAPTGRCRHEWPNESHLLEIGTDGRSLVDFCKEFELC